MNGDLKEFISSIENRMNNKYDNFLKYLSESAMENTTIWYNRHKYIKENTIDMGVYTPRFNYEMVNEYCNLVVDDVNNLINDMNKEVLLNIKNPTEIQIENYLGVLCTDDVENNIDILYQMESHSTIDKDISFVISNYNDSKDKFRIRTEIAILKENIESIFRKCISYNEFKQIDVRGLKERIGVLEDSFNIAVDTRFLQRESSLKVKNEIFNDLRKGVK